MISRYEAYMDGIALSSVHPELIILDISHNPADKSYNTGMLANRKGLIITGETQQGASVTVLFELHIYSIAERQRAVQEVQRWASGRILETNDREGQQLYVRCTQMPKIESALKWTEPIGMTFTAFERASWEEKTPAVLDIAAGTAGSSSLFVPGNNGKTVVEIEATPAVGSTLDAFSITVGNTTMTFASLGATNANPLIITYDDRLIQSIRCGTTSKMDKRTGESSDDLLAECGAVNDVSFTAGVSTAVTLSAKGVWL